MNAPETLPSRPPDQRRVLALSGGIGGAKLALGLSRILEPDVLTVVANTGDDFEHLGLHVSPDLDTLMYTLAGLSDPDRGWGRKDETWAFMSALAELGGATWFQLGDRDLATNVERTHRLAQGQRLSEITAAFCDRLGLRVRLLPMTDDRVRTRIRTAHGWLDFQDYFVRQRCAPEVLEVTYDGAADARAHPDILQSLADPDLRAVVICPSNPILSVEPMLAISELREALAVCPAPVVAVSPIIGGAAVKGPTVKIMRELGIVADAAETARRYAPFLDAYVLDERDRDLAATCGVPTTLAQTLMQTLDDKETLARAVLKAADGVQAASRAAGKAQ